ncbi:hypothetical protein J6590_008891 [Homalodisca vitripennis]|nr:hypothetical protein J6590_008891 [Homalodisca vitripennis]
MDEINNILQNQIKGRELYKEEEKRLKMEERADLDKLKQKMIEEEESAKRERELKKQKMYEEMEEVKRQSAELHARRQAQEKVLNDMFSQLIQQELKREQDKIQDNKSQLRKESDFFRAYLQETAEKRKAAEAEADNLRALEVAKIEAAKHKQEVEKCEAVLKLKELGQTTHSYSTRAAGGGGGWRADSCHRDDCEPDERILRGEYIVQALASSDKGPAGRTNRSVQMTNYYLVADGRL